MTDRIAHDHPTVDTFDAKIGRHGGTTRPEVVIEESLAVEHGTLVRLVLDGTEYRAPVEVSEAGSAVLRHAAAAPSGARNPGSVVNALAEWLAAQNLEIGHSLHLDVVEPGFRYGLRAPGDQAIYDAGRPDESLAGIARSLDSTDDDATT
ncbi:MAG: hypothetical protein U5K70_09275 [Halodesulfurarchaeum sp.]|nr:hypothetical protein [Halodesulfurarchaeum sp.]